MSHALKYVRELQKFLMNRGDNKMQLFTSKMNRYLEKYSKI